MTAVIEGMIDLTRGSAMIVPVRAAAPGGLGPSFSAGMPLDAFLDTGATNSALTKDVISALRLSPSGNKVSSMTHAGPVTQPTFLFDLGLVAPPQYGTSGSAFFRTVGNCTAVEQVSEIAGCKIVLGMDVLATLGLTLFPNGRFYLNA